MDLKIRDLDLAEADIAGDFFHRHWREDHIFARSRELLLWQYYHSPYARLFTQGMTFRTAWDADRCVGVFAWMPFPLNCYGRRAYGCSLSAWWVAPECRNSMVGLRLLASLQRESGFEACVAGMNTSVAETIYGKLKWVVCRNIPRQVFIVDAARFSQWYAQSGRDLIPRCHHPSTPNSTRNNSQDVEIRELTSIDQLARLGWDHQYWRRLSLTHIGPARELPYLVWRYQEIPQFRYRFLVAISAGEACGLLIFRQECIRDRDEIIFRIVDLTAEDDSAAALIGAAIACAREANAVIVDYFCTSQCQTPAFRSVGFIDARQPGEDRYWLPHLFQPLEWDRSRLNASWWTARVDYAAAKEDFFLTKGDYEFDRPN